MANSLTHILPYPILNARYTLPLTFRTSAGTPTDPTTPDTEFSTDGGATFSDCAEEITTGGSNGMGYLTLTGAETNNRVLLIAAKSANCVTTPAILHPRALASIGTGTLSAGSSTGGTLGTLLAYDVTNCFILTTGGTGGGGTGGANNQARRILTYDTSTGAFTVSAWETTPNNTTTYTILLPEGVTLGMLKAVNPATPGQTLNVSNVNTLAGHDPGATLGTSTLTQAQVSGGAYALNSSSFSFNAALDLTSTQKTSVQTASDSAITANTLINAIASYIDTEITTILSRIGAWTGSGVNTILGAFKALLSKVASTPSDIGGTFDPSTDSTEALQEQGAAIKAKTDTLVSFPTATVTGTPTTTSVQVTGLASTTANAYKDAYALFLTGGVINPYSAAFPVLTSAYNAGTTTLTFTGLLAAPSVGDTLLLVGSLKQT